LVAAVNEVRPGSWRAAKVAMKINGQPDKREGLRTTLRRALGSSGERGQELLASIPHTVVEPPDADVVQEPAQEPAAATEAPEATQGTPGGVEGETEPQEPAQEPAQEPGADEPEPEVLEGEFVELPPYDQSVHSSLVDQVTELRGVLEGMDGGEPTLELEESRAEAQAELERMLEALDAMNRAAEAAGQQRVEA
jgi:hypothetical protein